MDAPLDHMNMSDDISLISESDTERDTAFGIKLDVLDGKDPKEWSEVNEHELDEIAKGIVRCMASSTEIEEGETGSFGVGIGEPPPLIPLRSDDAGSCLQAYLRLTRDQFTTNTGHRNPESLRDRALGGRTKPPNTAAVAEAFGNLSVRDLSRTLDALRFELSASTEQLKMLVKENFDRFITSSDVIRDVTARFDAARLEGGTGAHGATPQAVIDGLERTQEAVDLAFGQLMHRQEKVETLQRTLGLLSRYETIVSMPLLVRQACERGDFRSVVLRYENLLKFLKDGPEDAKGFWKRMEPEIARAMASAVHTLVAMISSSTTRLEDAVLAVQQLVRLRDLGVPEAQHEDPEKIFFDARCSSITFSLKNEWGTLEGNMQRVMDEVDGMRSDHAYVMLFKMSCEAASVVEKLTYDCMQWIRNIHEKCPFRTGASSIGSAKIGSFQSSGYGAQSMGSVLALYEETMMEALQRYMDMHRLKLKHTMVSSHGTLAFLQQEYPSKLLSQVLNLVTVLFAEVSLLDAVVRSRLQDFLIKFTSTVAVKDHEVTLSFASSLYRRAIIQHACKDGSGTSTAIAEFHRLLEWSKEEHAKLMSTVDHTLITCPWLVPEGLTSLDVAYCQNRGLVVEAFLGSVVDGVEEEAAARSMMEKTDLDRQESKLSSSSSIFISGWSVLEALDSDVPSLLSLTKYGSGVDDAPLERAVDRAVRRCRSALSNASEALLQRWISHYQSRINANMEGILSIEEPHVTLEKMHEVSNYPPWPQQTAMPPSSSWDVRPVVWFLISNLWCMHFELLTCAPVLVAEILSETLAEIMEGLCDLIGSGLFSSMGEVEKICKLYKDLDTVRIALASLFSDIIDDDVDCDLKGLLKSLEVKLANTSSKLGVGEDVVGKIRLEAARSAESVVNAFSNNRSLSVPSNLNSNEKKS